MLSWPRQTAHREAEKALHWLENIFIRADREGRALDLSVESGTNSRLIALWKAAPSEELRASPGCAFQSLNAPSGPLPTYSPQWGSLTPALTIQVSDAQGNIHYLFLSGQGRLRTSSSRSESGE